MQIYDKKAELQNENLYFVKNSRYLILKAAFSVVFPAFKSFFVGEMLFESSIKAVDGKKTLI